MLYNYTVFDISNSVTGQDNTEITDARLTVKQLLEKKDAIRIITATDICSDGKQRSYQWKKMENVFLSGFTSIGGKTFDSLEEAKIAAINLTDANGVTFQKNNKKYTVRKGLAIVDNDNENSWLKIPL